MQNAPVFPRISRGIFGGAFGLAVFVLGPAARADKVDACIDAAERGQQLHRAHSLRAAREALLVCSRETCPVAISSDCKRWLAEVDASMPTVVFRATDGAGHDLVDVTVIADGAPLTKRLDGRPLPMDPGEHALRFEAPGSLPITSRVVVREGERDRAVAVELPSRDAPAPSASTAAGARSDARPAPERRGIPAASWVLGAVGVAAIGTGAALWISGRSDRTDLFAACGNTRTCTGDDESAAKTKLLVGDVVFGAGVVALGAAVWIAVAQTRAPPAASRISARPTGGGAILGYFQPF